MRIYLALVLSFVSNIVLAIGWEEVSPEVAKRIGVNLSVEVDIRSGCHQIEANVPRQIVFDEMGEMTLYKVLYFELEAKEKGWQLHPKGTKVELSAVEGMVRGLCVSDTKLPVAYISLLYNASSGTPPMVLLLNLKEFNK